MADVDHLAFEDVFNVGEGTPPDLVASLEAYLKPFAAPTMGEDGEPVCPNCRKPIDGLKCALGIDAVAWRWGLVHGECHCSGCGWPGRGMHYIKDEADKEIVTLRNVFLAYHPDYVTETCASEHPPQCPGEFERAQPKDTPDEQA